MKQQAFLRIFISILLIMCYGLATPLYAQLKTTEKLKKASKKIQRGIDNNNKDTLAQGYFDLAVVYNQKGELSKSEAFYQKAKIAFEKIPDAEGVAKSSRALAKLQEELHKNKEALDNYSVAAENSKISGNVNLGTLNKNDVTRLSMPDSFAVQQQALQSNIDLGIKTKDTSELIANYDKMATISLQNNASSGVLSSYKNAYQLSANNPEKARWYNQLLTDEYVKDKNFKAAIATKKQLINESFVQSSTQATASEITSLAQIYIQQNEDSTAIRLLNESYQISVKNGHTLEAKKNIDKLDSIFQHIGQKGKSLKLYRDFISQLPAIIDKDSSLVDNRIILETEDRLKILEKEKKYKDELIRKKNTLNYWLAGSLIVLAIFVLIVLWILKKLRIKNKKIALQSLRREMNPHFIFNSLNSINQFIANNNELEANQYLTKFSTLMRSVMENSKEDLIIFSKEVSLLRNYLELERSRFPDKFNFNIQIDDALYADEQLFIPGMLIQPHLENAIWHGLRYMDEKGFLQLSFSIKNKESIDIMIEDNGIGIAASRKTKTTNQQQHNGRGITNTLERIKILNELYHQHITCVVEDKAAPDHGVKVKLTVPFLKNPI